MNPFMILGVVGPWQIILIIVVVLLLFGGKKIPELMKGIGQGAREFKKGLNGDEEEKKKDEAKKE
jgi:sec-independent protein translocase protein TatA